MPWRQMNFKGLGRFENHKSCATCSQADNVYTALKSALSSDTMKSALIFFLILLLDNCLGLLELQDKLFINLTNPAVYNKRTRPSYIIGLPILVRINAVIQRMDGMDDVHTEYESDVEFTLRWRDDRLEYNPGVLLNFPIQGDHWHANEIWLPNIHVANDRQYASLINLTPGSIHLLVKPDGEVVLSKRAHLKLRCEMELSKYPLDTQKCGMSIESSSLPISHLRIQWSERPGLLLADPSQARGFLVQNYSTYEGINHRLVGNFSLVTSEFVLARQFGPFLLDIYIPGVLFVITSWISLWMEITAAPARISLSITSMLTMVTSGKSIREKLPKVPYVHALDVWLLVCTAFIFLVLIEYAIVNYVYNSDKRIRQGGLRRIDSCVSLASSIYPNSPESVKPVGEPISKRRAKQMGMDPTKPPQTPPRSGSIFKFPPDLDIPPPSPNPNSMERAHSIVKMPLTSRDIANRIDRICRLLFPLAFLLFNVGYWTLLAL